MEAGSTAHDISVGHEDLDFTVLRLEPFSELITGPSRRQSMMLRTKPEGVKSEPGDIDLQVYTLRRFVELAAGRKPIGADDSLRTGRVSTDRQRVPCRNHRQSHRSKRAGSAFRGYIDPQQPRAELRARPA